MVIKRKKQLSRSQALELINSVERPVTIATLQETFSAIEILMASEDTVVIINPNSITMGKYIVKGALYNTIKQFLWTH